MEEKEGIGTVIYTFLSGHVSITADANGMLCLLG